jgi:hypothetical protein
MFFDAIRHALQPIKMGLSDGAQLADKAFAANFRKSRTGHGKAKAALRAHAQPFIFFIGKLAVITAPLLKLKGSNKFMTTLLRILILAHERCTARAQTGLTKPASQSL